MSTEITAGTRVRFTAKRLGLTSDPGATHFVEPVALRGDEGIYCPCHRSHFEVIS